MIKITLTKKQLEQLAPYFKKSRESKDPGLIAAQVFHDGMIVEFIDGSRADALCKAVSGEFDNDHVVHSAQQAIDAVQRGRKDH